MTGDDPLKGFSRFDTKTERRMTFARFQLFKINMDEDLTEKDKTRLMEFTGQPAGNANRSDRPPAVFFSIPLRQNPLLAGKSTAKNPVQTEFPFRCSFI